MPRAASGRGTGGSLALSRKREQVAHSLVGGEEVAADRRVVTLGARLCGTQADDVARAAKGVRTGARRSPPALARGGLRTSWIARPRPRRSPRSFRDRLPAPAPEELPINAPRLVKLRGDHGETAHFRDAGTELDVCPAPGMFVATVIRPRCPAQRDDLGFLLVLARIQQLVLQPCFGERALTRSEAATERVPMSTGRPSFASARARDAIARHFSSAVRCTVVPRSRRCTGRLVGILTTGSRYTDHSSLRSRAPFRSFPRAADTAGRTADKSFARPRPAGRQRHTLLRLDHLMQGLLPRAVGEDPAGVLVDDLHLLVADDVVRVAMK